MRAQTSTLVVAFGLSLASLLMPQDSWSDTILSQEQIYFRCYGHIARGRPATNDSRLAAIRAGTLSAVDGCMQLLQLANFRADGQVTHRDAGDAPSYEATRVLQTFNDFHRTWFDTDFQENAPAFLMENIMDPAQPAYHLTYAVFGPGAQYSSVVSGTDSFESIRQTEVAGYQPQKHVISGSWSQPPSPVRVVQENSAGTVTFPFVALGRLSGIRVASPLNLGPTALYIEWRLIDVDGVPGIDYKGTLGGGLLGTLPYFLFNNGRPIRQTTDGGAHVHRRFSKQVMKNLLCRELPVLRSVDAGPYVQPTSTLPFRSGVSCMRCHATIDPMAFAVRNLHATTVNTVDGGQPPVSIVRRFPRIRSAETGPVDNDLEFFLRPPTGTLRFRSYDGSLVNQPIEDIRGLGNALAQTNDLYACAAKRYFKFFTGIDVNLQDAGDPDTPQINSKDTDYRNFVLELGTQLRSHQSVQSLIRSILSSAHYRKSGYGVKE